MESYFLSADCISSRIFKKSRNSATWYLIGCLANKKKPRTSATWYLNGCFGPDLEVLDIANLDRFFDAVWPDFCQIAEVLSAGVGPSQEPVSVPCGLVIGQ